MSNITTFPNLTRLNLDGKSTLEFMKEHQPELYAELLHSGKLESYIMQTQREMAEQTEFIAQQMGGDANAQACAREIVRTQMYERSEE